MVGAVLLRAGRRLRWVGPDGTLGPELHLGRDPEEGARLFLRRDPVLPEALQHRLVGSAPPSPVRLADPSLRAVPGFRSPSVAELPARRAARELGWPALDATDREFYLALARAGIQEALNDPVEVLISLAREEERVERARGREEAAAQHFLAPAGGDLDTYRSEWTDFRAQLERHHQRLVQEVERSARAVAPNLSALVGPRVAARLLARAGGLADLARMSSSKLQLLGSRRRPGPDRSPRFGIIYRADRMGDVPAGRQGAFARSLAALASTAVRLDAVRPEDRSQALVARRDRRIRDLTKVRR